MPIQLERGDLLKQEQVDAIVNTVNCVGVMGKGIALQFRNKWPKNYDAYRAACDRGEVRIGEMFIFDLGGLVKPNFIINFPTKQHWKGKSQLEYIVAGLQDLTRQVRQLGIRSLAMPPLGCGNGGLDWADVLPEIQTAFQPLNDVQVVLFEPTGAPDPKTMEVRTEKPRMTLARAAIVAALEVYRDLGYGLSRIEVQKLVYFLQEAGVPFRKVEFTRDQYGPYSDALRHALENMEGHFIRGLGDGVVDAEIEPTPFALVEANAFLSANGEGSQLARSVERVAALIEGFQSPYGMELLATVHWTATRLPKSNSISEALAAVRQWSPRKALLMQPEHVAAAWQRLAEQGWIAREPQAGFG